MFSLTGGIAKEAAAFTNNSLLFDKWQQLYSITLNYKQKILTGKTPVRLSLGFSCYDLVFSVFE